MKKIISVFVLFVLLSLSAFAQYSFNDQPFLSAVASASGNGLLNSLVHYYKADGFTNNQAWDEVNALTLFEGVQNDFSSNNAGIINACIASTGGGGLCILDTNNAPADTSASTGGSQSFQMWVWLNASQVSATTTWIASANSTDGTIYSLTFSRSTGKFTWNYKDSTGANVALAYSISPTTQAWHQLVFGVDMGNSQLFMFQDGAGKQTATFTNGPKVPTVQSHFTIFNVFPNQTGDPAGRFDETAVYHGRALSGSDASTLYNSGAALPFSSFTH